MEEQVGNYRESVLDLTVVEQYRYGMFLFFQNNIITIILNDSLPIGKPGCNIYQVYLTFLG